MDGSGSSFGFWKHGVSGSGSVPARGLPGHAPVPGRAEVEEKWVAPHQVAAPNFFLQIPCKP